MNAINEMDREATTEQDGATEIPLIENIKMTTSLPANASAPPTERTILMWPEKIFPDNLFGLLIGTGQMINLVQSRWDHHYKQHVYTFSPSRYSMCRWLDAFLFSQQTTAWDMWRYWNGVDNLINCNAFPGICMIWKKVPSRTGK